MLALLSEILEQIAECAKVLNVYNFTTMHNFFITIANQKRRPVVLNRCAATHKCAVEFFLGVPPIFFTILVRLELKKVENH